MKDAVYSGITISWNWVTDLRKPSNRLNRRQCSHYRVLRFNAGQGDSDPRLQYWTNNKSSERSWIIRSNHWLSSFLRK